MPYVTCEFCGHGGIQALNIGVCMTCLKFGGDKTKIHAIRKLLKQHKEGLTELEISKALGISVLDIQRYKEEGILYEINSSEKNIDIFEEKENSREEKIRALRERYSVKTNIINEMSSSEKSKLVEDLEKLKQQKNKGFERDD